MEACNQFSAIPRSRLDLGQALQSSENQDYIYRSNLPRAEADLDYACGIRSLATLLKVSGLLEIENREKLFSARIECSGTVHLEN